MIPSPDARPLSSLSLLLLFALFAAPVAHAVQTKNCPDSISVVATPLSLFSPAEVRTFRSHAKYTEAMLTEALNSRDRVEKHLPNGLPEAQLPLSLREAGRCYYRLPNRFADRDFADSETSRFTPAAAPKSRQFVLYTKKGKDLLRDEFELPYQRRENETFLVETEIAHYSPAGLELRAETRSPLKVTVHYPCYDAHCLSEAKLGEAQTLLR